MSFAVFIFLLVAGGLIRLYYNRYRIGQTLKDIKYGEIHNKQRNDLLASSSLVKEKRDHIKRLLFLDHEQLFDEFGDDLRLIYGHDFRQKFEADYDKYLKGIWKPPAPAELLLDISLAKEGKIECSRYDYGFDIGPGMDAMTAIRFRTRVESRLKEAGKEQKLYLLPVAEYRNGKYVSEFRPKGKMVLKHQFFQLV